MTLPLLGGGSGSQSIALAGSFVAFDPATITNVTLSGSNLVATNTATTSADQGAHVPTISGKSSGKIYFEITYSHLSAGVNLGFGVGLNAATYTNMGNGAVSASGVMCFPQTGTIWANGSTTGKSISNRSVGDVIGVAIDLGNLKIWFKKVNATAGNWNGDALADPATNTNGVAYPSGASVPFVTFGGTSGLSGNILTANFGASGFTGGVPSGFSNGWPI